MRKDFTRLDERRLIAIPGDSEETLEFSVEHWVDIANESIADHGFFAVALSGGSTPKKIFAKLSQMPDALDWSKVFLFWGDERSVTPDDQDSNYHMAIIESGLGSLPIAQNHIFRMVAETDIDQNAQAYEKLIKEKLGAHPFDLIMLGMGDDGHTASLFPHTKALHVRDKLVVANHVPQKQTWRMSLTYTCINQARHVSLYVIGDAKAEILKNVLTSNLDFEKYPSQLIGTEKHPALWVVDKAAGKYF